MEIFVAVLSCLAVAVLAFQELAGIRRGRAQQSAGVAWGERRRKDMAVSPERLRQAVAAGAPYAVLMEVATPATTLTLAAFADGRASLYSSAGGDVLDGEGDEAVREAAIALVAEAKAQEQSMTAVSHCPRPAFGNVRFNVINGTGVLAVEEDEEALDKGWSCLAALYQAGVRTIQALRQVPDEAVQP